MPLIARASQSTPDLTSLSLEQLLEIEVTIVSKTVEHASDAAAAVAVITGDDIRRSGASSFAEALRLAPGLHVSQVTSNTWEVSSRGFSNTSSAKLLVLVDGRSVYTPLFSGVFWEVQDMLLEDVDRIEVVRGPGASLWGSNAMNGVINILTKKAKDTQGLYAEGGGGNEQRGFAGVRYGGAIGDKVFYRLYAKVFDRDGGSGAPDDRDDGWRMARLGFRLDAELGGHDTVTVHGDGYLGRIGQVQPALSITGRPPPEPPLESDLAGGSVTGAWTHEVAKGAELLVRAYYDRSHRDDPTYRDDLDTVDVELQGRLQLPLSQELLVGAGYRLMHDHLVGKGIAELRPADSVDHLVSAFVQDNLALFDRRLRIAVGTKLEHNDFSGFELQPNARVAVDPAAGHTLWAAVSRAVRVPTRVESDIFAIVGDPAMDPAYHIVGNRDLASETLIAAELGYRFHAAPSVYLDVAGFYFKYDRLISFEFGSPFVDNGQNVVPIREENSVRGHSFGGEATVTVVPIGGLKLVASYSYNKLTLEPEGMDVSGLKLFEGASPRHQVAFRSLLDLPGRWSVGAFFRWVDRLPTAQGGVEIPSYAEIDARVAWMPIKKLEISVVGQSLLHDHHAEFSGGTEVERSVYGKIAAWF